MSHVSARIMTRGARSQAPLARLGRFTLLALLALTGCESPPEPDAPITAEEFVKVVVALREAERGLTPEDSVAVFRERKTEILERHGVTEAELRRFVVAHGEDVARLQAVWDTISQRLKHVPDEAAGEPPDE